MARYKDPPHPFRGSDELDELAEVEDLGLGDEDLDADAPTCRECGCSQLDPCPGGCIWAEPDLCSRCV